MTLGGALARYTLTGEPTNYWAVNAGYDFVFFAGDTIDEDVSRFVERKMPEALSKLKPKFGVFTVLGNHEYLGGNSSLAVESLQQAGVRVLRDEYIKVNDQFYIVGRDDRMVGNITGKPCIYGHRRAS